jgi:Tfp pilus assembly protein PilP
MKHMSNVIGLNSFLCFGLALSLTGILTGCEEVNVALDSVLGIQSPVLAASAQTSPLSVIPAKKRLPGEKPAGAPPTESTSAPEAKRTQAAPEVVQVPEMKGKRRQPGRMSPAAAPPEAARKEIFVMGRDPFEQPTEILPSECPPSMPLCRFDRSQLKLVGIIQVSEGNFKAMVEDPDGRGYFVTAGMQIGSATVTQVTNKGVTLHLHRTHQDVQLPLFSEVRGAGE